MPAFVAPMSTVAELSDRLTMGDTSDDAVLSEMLLGISSAIEGAAGRPLRRGHVLRERIHRDGRVARVRCYPIAAVHWVRESLSYNFDDADEYTELVEGEDFVLEPGAVGQAPGETGLIRRLGSNWSEGEFGATVEICYTGGYKTAAESAAENATVTLSGVAQSGMASLQKRVNTGALFDGYNAVDTLATFTRAGVVSSGGNNQTYRSVLWFPPGLGAFIPTWQVVEATLTLKVYLNSATGTASLSGWCGLLDPRSYLGRVSELWTVLTALAAAGRIVLATSVTTSHTAGSPLTVTMTIHSDAGYYAAQNLAAINTALRERGVLAFAFREDAEAADTNLSIALCSPAHATAGNRPSLVVVHRDPICDLYTMPDDLRNACHMQTVNDWQTRKQPGFRQETQRGVSISSGTSYLKDPSDLLPAVRAVALSYAGV